jgi:hypothetical protein
VVIPVFFRLPGALKRQHYVRIAGYCQLIEHCERVRSPYGLVVEKGSYVAHVLKNTQNCQSELRKVLRAAQEIIRRAAVDGDDPLPPKSSGPCMKCHVGFPRLHRVGETELVCNGEPVEPRRLLGVDRRIYHSKCGDRFWWVPQHNRMAEKKMVRYPEDTR